MDNDKSRIERLKRALYSRDENLVPKETRTPVASRETAAPRDWGTPQNFDVPYDAMVKKSKSSFFTSFLGLSLIFFCVSLGIAAFIFFGGLNMISSNNVDMKIVGS